MFHFHNLNKAIFITSLQFNTISYTNLSFKREYIPLFWERKAGVELREGVPDFRVFVAQRERALGIESHLHALAELCVPVHAMPSVRSERRLKTFLECTACSNGSFAEHIHQNLLVSICGSCSVRVSARDVGIEGKNEISCIWCGRSDGCELMMCDYCVLSFCADCILRNFGPEELKAVRQAEIWKCYACNDMEKIVPLRHNVSLNSLDKVFSQLSPPKKILDCAAYATLSVGELNFAAMFLPNISDGILFYADIIGYLTAKEVFGKVCRVSKALRNLFCKVPMCSPGLFRTPHDIENNTKLFNHQLESLQALHDFESCETKFEALRGGIFGDEPGLGKTVTMLALILSTVGHYPQRQRLFWNEDDLNAKWASINQGSLLLPILNRLLRARAVDEMQPAALLSLRKLVMQPTFSCTLTEFENSGMLSNIPFSGTALMDA